MKKRFLTRYAIVIAALAVVAAAAPSAWAAETIINLTAGPTTLTMPGGPAIPMWGFGLTGSPITVPGPQLVVPPGNSLRINLTNNLPADNPVSIVIPGLPMPLDGVSATPKIVRNDDGRMRSFTHETANGETAAYVWPSVKPGTYLYQSGTHQAVQVQMGLYGSIFNNVVAGQAYPGKNYARQIICLLSEIDPALHAAVTDGTYGTPAYPSTIDYNPKYFLINGKAYPDTAAQPFRAIAGQSLLIRFLNSGLQTRVPTFLGMDVNLIAEDGNAYAHPKTQYTVPLPAGKTTDALVTPSAAGRFPLFDRALGVANAANRPGGMLTRLEVAAAP
jgi:FtsP/CotA-like multicopper oxidase with cupredoxin domain